MGRALSETSVSSSDAHAEPHARRHFWALTLGSIGVVYGDIGTSPLYAMREAVLASGATATAGPEIILGILSLIIWALILVVTIKYVLILLRADNEGEGGTLSDLDPFDEVDPTVGACIPSSNAAATCAPPHRPAPLSFDHHDFQ